MNPMRLQPAAATPIELKTIFQAWTDKHDSVRRFGSAVAQRIGASSSLPLSSLMRNTFIAVESVKRRLPPGTSIILPRYSCPSFLHGIRASHMPYRYCDMDPATLRVEYGHLDAARDSSVGALLIPNLFGLSSDMGAISEYCRSSGWLLIEGADYTLGGILAGQPLGSFGDVTILNFQEGKALPIGGGMALSKSSGVLGHAAALSEVSNLVGLLRSVAYAILIQPGPYGAFHVLLKWLGISKKRFSMEDTIRKTRSEVDFALPAKDVLQSISAFQASLGLRLLQRLDEDVCSRSSLALELETVLRGIPEIQLIPRHAALEKCHYIRYPILVQKGRRNALAAFVTNNGFEASAMYVEHGMNIDSHQFPGASRICDELLTLPCHLFMTSEDIQRLGHLVRQFFRGP
jgi:dTDP-4-amino-4,6-dideoxygalactose transaminase